MNKISGKIVAMESGFGIPDLLVVVYDIDPQTQPEEIIGARSGGSNFASLAVLGQGFPGDRLGSVLTDSNGAFELMYEDDEFRLRNQEEKRPDLFLIVMAPEDSSRDMNGHILFTSPAVRQNAGRVENFMIRLSAEQLEQAGILLPTVPDQEREDASSLLRRLATATEREEKIAEGTREIIKQRVTSARALMSNFWTKVKPALRRELSRVPEQLRDPERFVAPGESVLQKSTNLIQRNIEEIVNSSDPKKRSPVRGFVSLTDDEREELLAQTDVDGLIPLEALEAVLVRNRGQRTTTFVSREDPLAFCRERSLAEKECGEMLSGNGVQTPPHDGNLPSTDVEPATSEDVPRYIARLMDSLTSPEEKIITGLTPKATRGTVHEDIQSLSLERSPADVPSFHEFHNLQIAFEHVWQEAIDQGLLDIAEDAYETIVELGGDPDREEDDDGNHSTIRVLRSEGRSVLRAHRGARDYRSVRDQRGGSGDVRDRRGVSAHVRDHRRESADPEERLPELLAELERRLREQYAFTGYAANRKERSVNFGILVTYLLEITPLRYQAGPLVKTIPLAPKQTQKLVITHKRSKKRSRKEVENNLSSVREESSQTSRVEQEIVRRASTKTNFSLTTEGSYDVGISEGKSTTTFGREASKNSDDVKKAFREAVFKAAQEFKQEHTTEINVEEVDEFESVETSEISNPNDEIAMTCLFFELQRLCRVKMYLYRAIPVVLVAQEVPEPDEIDEDWLVAHDWILRRVILDDQFLPALNYLSQSVVGDEVALAEMRRNVEDQRQVVNTLKVELAIVKEQAPLLRTQLESAIAEKFDGLPSFFREAVESVIAQSPLMKEAAEQAVNEARDLLFRLEREVTALNALTETYTRALSAHLNQRTQIARLQVHVKENILYYMQAIWSYEPPDQRFFRLHEAPVPVLEARSRRFFVDLSAPIAGLRSAPHESLPRFGGRMARTYRFESRTEIEPDLVFAPLAQVADLDNLLSYKGNYMIFPLYESNALTDFMMDPYVDRALGQLVDPADPDNWSLEEFSHYVCCLKEELAAEEFEEIRPQLEHEYERLLAKLQRTDDLLVLPQDSPSLFIEILPSGHSLIEEFKAQHRAVDVEIAKEEQRRKGLESVRLAARLLAGEREDPDIEAKYVFNGDGTATVLPPSPGNNN